MFDISAPDPQQLAAIPPEILKTFPASQPPLGVQSNFVDPEQRLPALRAIATLLLCLMTFCYVIRVYTNAFIIRRAEWDDCKGYVYINSVSGWS